MSWKTRIVPKGKPHRVIIVFGLAACGKSTLARALGQRLGLRVVHPSGLLRDLMEGGAAAPGRPRANDGYWETSEGARRLSERLHHEVPVDVAATQVLLQEIDRGEVVIDSWSLPWLSPVGFKIHLKAELSTRAERAARRANQSLEEARQRIATKDEQTRQLFLRLYDFDIFQDFGGRFHLTIDTDARNSSEVEELAMAALMSRSMR